jgi:hypothetical protein
MPSRRTFLSVAFLCVVAQPGTTAHTAGFLRILALPRRVVHEITKRAAAGLASAERLETTGVARYGLSPDDFTTLSASIDPVFARLTVIDQEALAYQATTGTNPNVTTLQAFYSRRLAVLSRGMEALRNHMSPAGWAALTTYINRHLSLNNSRYVMRCIVLGLHPLLTVALLFVSAADLDAVPCDVLR